MSIDVPPQNLEAELGLLGSLLLEASRIDEVRTLVRVEDLYLRPHRSVLEAIYGLSDEGLAADALTVGDWLEQRGRLAEVEADDVIGAAVRSVPHALNAVYYAEIVRQKALARELIVLAERVIRDAYAANATATDLVQQAEASLFALADRGTAAVGPRLIREPLREAMAQIERQADGLYVGVPSGLYELDRLTGGFQPGQMIVVGARPSQGKTAFALTCANHAAIGFGMPTLFVSIEMSGVQIARRLLVMGAELDSQKFNMGEPMTTDEHIRFVQTEEALRLSEKLWVDDGPVQTAADILAAARRLKRAHGLAFLVVDYLQLLTPAPGHYGNRQEEIAAMSKMLKRVARELDIPVMVLSQLNRNVEARADKTPTMADIRESGAVENDADIIILLHRPEKYDETDRPGEADLIIDKNRNGMTSKLRMAFVGSEMRFAERQAAPIDAGAF